MPTDPPDPTRFDRRHPDHSRWRPAARGAAPPGPTSADRELARRAEEALRRLRAVLETTERRLGSYLDAAVEPASRDAPGERRPRAADLPELREVPDGEEQIDGGGRPAGRPPTHIEPPASTRSRTASVVVADDNERFRRGLVEALDVRPGLRVVGEAADGRSTRELVRSLRPRVVLCDLRMPDVDGVELIRDLATAPRLLGVRIAVLSSYGDELLTLQARAAGANTSVDKSMSRREIADVVEALANG